MNKLYLILSVYLLVSINVAATATFENTSKQLLNDTIQFVLNDHNNIIVESILNKEDTVSLMFHTAVGTVSLTPDKSEQLRSKEIKNTSSTSWTGTKDSRYIENNSLQIFDFKWDSLTVWLDMLSGPESDGKFGPSLFEGSIIEIDNDQNLIILHDPANLNIDNTQYQKFKLSTDKHESLFIEGEISVDGQKIRNKFLIHSGYGGTIILDDHFCKENEVFSQLEVIEEKELKDSHGNIIKTKKVKVDTFKVFDVPFSNTPLSYFDSELEIQQTSVMGGEFLKRFNLLIDIENLEVYVSTNRHTLSLFKTI